MKPEKHDPQARAAELPIWSGRVEPQPLTGGITNTNFVVEDAGRRFFVRIGEDIPVHGVMRFNELAAARAACAAGISPKVVHAEPGVFVTEFVEGRTLTEGDVRDEAMLERIVPLVRTCHREVARQVSAPALMFWVFHIMRHYAEVLRVAGSRRLEIVPDLMRKADRLEAAVGLVEIVFGHNDLLAANFIDDGSRLWLVDWDYAGFNSPLFDLGGLSSNSQLLPEQEALALRLYYGHEPDEALWRAFRAMKAASLLRETMWSMVSEVHSAVDFDFEAYTRSNLQRFESAWAAFERAR